MPKTHAVLVEYINSSLVDGDIGLRTLPRLEGDNWVWLKSGQQSVPKLHSIIIIRKTRRKVTNLSTHQYYYEVVS